jgi:oligopeptide transport system permease protein
MNNSVKISTAVKQTPLEIPPPRSLWRDALVRLAHDKIAFASFVVILAFVLAALFAEGLAPYPHDFQSRTTVGNGGNLVPPVWVQNDNPALRGRAGYWLGTDRLGRDLLSRAIYAARVSLAAGFFPMILSLAIGVTVGMAAGFLGGHVDTLIMRSIDVLYAFPDLLFVLILVSVFRPQPLGQMLSGLLLILVAFGLTSWIGVARLVRGQVLVLREQEFIMAARVIGTPTSRIMLLHLLPNLLRPLIVYGTFAIPGFIAIETLLGYFVIGVLSSYPTWGGMIAEGQLDINGASHIFWVPGTCVALITVAFISLGDRLGEALDPTTGRGVVPPGGSRRPRKNPWRRLLGGAGARAGRR